MAKELPHPITVTCPVCEEMFVWDNQNHCPHCNHRLSSYNIAEQVRKAQENASRFDKR
jgi:hypothetical protein